MSSAPTYDVYHGRGRAAPLVGTHQHGIGFTPNPNGIELGFEPHPTSIPDGCRIDREESISAMTSRLAPRFGEHANAFRDTIMLLQSEANKETK